MELPGDYAAGGVEAFGVGLSVAIENRSERFLVIKADNVTRKQPPANGLAALRARDNDRGAALAQRFIQKTGDVAREPSIVAAIELNEVLMPSLVRAEVHADHRTFLYPTSQIAARGSKLAGAAGVFVARFPGIEVTSSSSPICRRYANEYNAA